MENTNTTTALTLPDESTFKHDISAINNFQRIVRENMREGQDYGVIPGTEKPTLLKPGAEKITKLLGLADKYDIISEIEDWDKPLFYYKVKCTLVSVTMGVVISEGLGSCNSKENKYRWRDARRKCPTCGKEAIIKGKEEFGGGWICFKKQGGCGAKWPDGAPEIENQVAGKVENDDIFSIVNTLLKMAEKRALVDAALHAGRLSEVFTQDIEDMPITPIVVEHAPANTKDITPPEKTTKAKSINPPENAQDGQEKGEPAQTEGFTVDKAWLDETLKLIHWTNATAISYIKTTYKVIVGKTLDETLRIAGKEIAEKFFKKLQEMRDSSGG